MKKKHIAKMALICGVLITEAYASANLVPSQSGMINYDWMDTIINKTSARSGVCPTLEIDLYKSGFKVARQKSYFASISKSGSKWFPKNEMWASVGVGPVANGFGIYFSDINNLDNMSQEKEKKLPQTAEEVDKWKVADSAYWESQGGVSFYLGTGIFPYDIGIFSIATGGWTNFLQKTGPNKVYVEMSKKHINSISFGAGISYPNISIEKVKESSMGFAYQFTLDNQENIEAFERFMAGDMTKAQDLSKLQSSGVVKISNMSEDRTGLSKSWGIALPFIPILSFRSSKDTAYDHSEENSAWDEKYIKDQGIYVKQHNTRIVGKHTKESRSFIGGRTLLNIPLSDTERDITEKFFGNFKYSYQADWGQENRLRKYIDRAKSLTGLVDEACVRVPGVADSLGFNQVVLEVNWSDSFMREIMGLGDFQGNFLESVKKSAKKYLVEDKNNSICNEALNNDDSEKLDNNCSSTTDSTIENSFANLEAYSKNMKKSYLTDKKLFARNVAKFGEEVWKTPYIFKAFYEKGKKCGLEYKYEVSGQRVTRHQINQKFAYTDSCISK